MKRTELKKVSKKEAAAQRRNRGWRAEVVARPCELRYWSACSGSNDPHEIVRRSSLRYAAQLEHLTIALCRRHHDIDDADPILAERLGIRIPRWAYDLDPEGTVAWCADTRAQLGGPRRNPYSAYFNNDRTPPWRES